MFKNLDLQLKILKSGPNYTVQLCNKGSYSCFIEQGVLDGLSRDTKVTILAWPHNIKCASLTHKNNTLMELKKEHCIKNDLDFKSICDFTSLTPGHYEILYEPTTALCDENNQCIFVELAGTVEYSHYPFVGNK